MKEESQRERIIFHVDMDSFYASVEARESPSYRNVPLIIGADPREGQGRGVVVTCSYEARKFGVRSGQPISRAYRLCPDGVYVRPKFELYGRVSDEVMNTLRSYAGTFEQVSIDEAFMDVTDLVSDYEGASKLAEGLKRELREKFGLTCSIGIAPNKSCAKIACETQKPDGLTVVEQGKVREFLAPLPVRAIPGVGKKTAGFLKSRAIETIGELQKVPGKQLVKYFGKGGVWLWGVAQGLEKTEVRERDTPKSLSVEHTFEMDEEDWRIILETVQQLVDELHERVLSTRLALRKVSFKIRFEAFQTFTREKTLGDFTTEKELIREAVSSLLEEFRSDRRKVRLVGVRVADLKKIEGKQTTLSS